MKTRDLRRAARAGDKPHSKTKTKKERRGCSTREEVDTGRKGRSRKKQGKLAVKATMLLSFFFCVGQFTKPQGCGGVPVKTGAGCSCRCSNGVWYHDIGGDCGEVAGEGRPWRLRARPSWSLGVGLTRGGGLYSQLLVYYVYE